MSTSSILQVTITTPTKTLFQGEAEQLTVRTSEGDITILPHHESLSSVLGVGPIRINGPEVNNFQLITIGGIIQIRYDHVKILTDEALPPTEESLQELEEAIAAAQEGHGPLHDITIEQLIAAEKQIRAQVWGKS